MLEKGFILPNINFEKANESIPLNEWNMKVPTGIRSWPASKTLVSVNNFGFGGSNAHCVLQRPALDLGRGIRKPSDGDQPKLLVMSGNREEAVEERAKQLGIYAEQHPEVFQKSLIRDLAYTLCERRSHMPWRTAVVGSCLTDIVKSLNGAETKPQRASSSPKIAFIFTGQGAQWYAMGRELMKSHTVFAETMQAADDCLRHLGASFSLLEELNKDKEHSEVGKAHLSQPACTAIQLALVRLLSSWGIEPLAVIGHSSGEIGAAFATGAISVEDAMAIAYFRGQVTLRMKAQHPHLRGAMLAVGASPTEVRKIIKTLSLQGAAVACENSPASVTVSGDASDIDALASELESRQIFNRKLHVDVAYHSTHMELVASEYFKAIENVTASGGSKAAFFSSLRGTALASGSMLTADYWTDNLVKPVLFSPALQALCREVQPTVLVEIGPHAALEGPVKQILREMGGQATGIKYCPSLVRNEHATVAALKMAGNLYVMGQKVAFDEINNTSDVSDVPSLIDDLAPYPWADEKHWREPRQSREHRFKPFGRHDLLGLINGTSNDTEHNWQGVLSTDEIPWLREHKMQSLTTFPLTGFLCMVTEAAAQRASLRNITFERFCMREIQVTSPLIMNDGDEYEMKISLRRHAEGTRSLSNEWDDFLVSSWAASRGWIDHCRGLVAVRKQQSPSPVGNHVQQDSRKRLLRASELCTKSVSQDDFYPHLQSVGAEYGPIFRMKDGESMKCGGGHSMHSIQVRDTASTMPFNYETKSILSATLIDTLVQASFILLGAGQGGMPILYMPNGIKTLEFNKTLPTAPGEEALVVCEGYPDTANLTPTDFSYDMWDPQNQSQPLLSMKGLTMIPVTEQNTKELEPASLCYKVEWEDLYKAGVEVNGTNGHVNGTNGHASDDNGHINGINGHVNGTNGHINNGANGHVHETKGHVNGTNGHSNGTNGHVDSSNEPFAAPVVIVSDMGENDSLVQSLMDLLLLKIGVTATVCPLDRLDASGKICVALCELNRPVIANITAKGFQKLQSILLTANAVLWVSSGTYKNAKNPENALAHGLFRTVRSEAGKLAATLDLDPDSRLDNDSRSELVLQALKSVLAAGEESSPSDFEFAETQGKLVVPRVVEDGRMNEVIQRYTRPNLPHLQPFDQGDRRLEIAIGMRGALDSLYFRDQIVGPLGDDQVEIKIIATGMNFKDVVIAMGQVSSSYLGVECSGIISKVGSKVTSLSVGDRVCAMSLGAYGTFARCKATSAAVIPDNMSTEVAASIPVVYSTAYYGMIELAHLEPGESILIHAASGGVGQAAIQLAKLIGAEVFATVGSADKKILIMEKYGIPENRIFYSRNPEFGPAIREATGGRGVDVVLNSLAGELLRESWECLAHFGRFIEIGKRDISSNTGLGMGQFEHNVTFSSVDLTLVAKERPKIMGRVLNSVMDLLKQKKISAIEPITVMGISELETALRTLQGGKSTGKIVIAPRAGEQVKATHRHATSLLKHNATYVIIGGTGGLGRSMAKRMVERGAKHIVLLSRNGHMTTELSNLSKDCLAHGATIVVKSCDVTDEGSVKQLIDECAKTLPPVRGIVHAAMVLRDMLFEKMAFEDFQKVVEAKVSGTWHFHRALSEQQLDFFVVLSSVAGIVGNRGQAAYAAANTFLDAFVQHRIQQGLPAASIDLTAVEGVGYLAENAARSKEVLQSLSGTTFGEAEVLALIEASFDGQISRLCNSQCITGLNFEGQSLPYYAEDARFSHLRDAFLEKNKICNAPGSGSQVPSQEEVARAATYDEAVAIVTHKMWDKLCAILMLPPQDTDPDSTVKSYGLDSLNAIELRNWIAKEYLAHLQVLELLTSGTIRDLAGLVLKKTKIKHGYKNP
ncbi:hypothetical protein CDD83_5286 [Cordyceps sp. RAO-2017]|nr:hypothetical protein CDD83_5286 [Cordyceps sp. RAO-2017]